MKDTLHSKSIGLVLSGGGVRGMAHIGVLKALDAYEISAEIVSGSSVGALIGAHYAQGNPVGDMLSFFKETPLFKYNFLTISKPGLVDTERYFDLFKGYFPNNSFEDLKKRLHVVATNLQQGSEEFFSKGELIMPLLASAALPPVFAPVEINRTLYADGGIMNNFPLEPLQGKVDFVIGSNVSIIKQVEKRQIRSSLQLANRTTSLMIYAISQEKIGQCDLIFEPQELEQIGVLDKKGIEKAYQIGYDHAARKLEKWMETGNKGERKRKV
jgi:NTE family protein